MAGLVAAGAGRGREAGPVFVSGGWTSPLEGRREAEIDGKQQATHELVRLRIGGTRSNHSYTHMPYSDVYVCNTRALQARLAL